jgi:hypothetical protein
MALGRNRGAIVLLAAAGSLALLRAEKRTPFSPHERAYYADPALVAYVLPGLKITIISATITSDGTISVDYKLTDPNGAPLDRSGVDTPGPISLSFVAGYIPKGQEQYVSYVVRSATGAVSGTVNQPAADSGGTTQTVSTGEYVYTFSTKAPSGFDPTATNRVGIYGSRNLTQFDLETNFADATGATQDTAECYMCHVNGSEAVLPIGKNPVVDPQGLENPTPATTSACTACHLNQSSYAHASVNTDPRFGESCDVCHGTGAAFSATQVHAGQ